MADIVRRGADKGIFSGLFNFDRVVCNKAVTALDEFNGSFALADSAVAHHEHTLAVDLNKNAVARYALGKLNVQKRNDVRHGV